MRLSGRTLAACGTGIMVTVLLLAAGCASVPRESAELSQTLGQQIQTLESAQEATIRAFFDDKRSTARRFMNDEWIPQFANSYLGSPKVSAMLEQTCGQHDHANCLRAILIISKQAEVQIQLQYRKILDPLAKMESALLAVVQTDYSETERENDAITALLTSASKVQAERQAVLTRIGINEGHINDALATVSEQVAKVTSNAKALDTKVTNFAKKMKAVRKFLRGSVNGGV